MLDEIQDLLQLQDSFVIAACACDTLQIVMITKKSDQKSGKIVQEQTARNHPASSTKASKKTVHSCTNVHIFRSEMMIDQNLLMNDLLHVSGAD